MSSKQNWQKQNKQVTEAEIIRNIKLAYYNYLYTVGKIAIVGLFDSVYTDFHPKQNIRYKVGETSKP